MDAKKKKRLIYFLIVNFILSLGCGIILILVIKTSGKLQDLIYHRKNHFVLISSDTLSDQTQQNEKTTLDRETTTSHINTGRKLVEVTSTAKTTQSNEG